MKKLNQNDMINKIGLIKSRFLYTVFLMFLIFNLLLCSSYAWISSNRNLNTNDMDMSLAVDDTSAVYEAFKYDIKTGKGTNLAVTDDGTETLNITNLVLNQYDTIFNHQNKNTPAFAKIVITRNKSMPKNSTIHFTIDRKDKDQSTEKLSDFSSSIIRFTLLTIDDKSDVAITDPDELYKLINTRERFEEVKEYSGNDTAFSKTFVNTIGEGNNHTHSKDLSITLSLDYNEQNWYVDSSGKEKMNLYLYITYDINLIKCYVNEHENDLISLNGTSFLFANDFKKIKATYTTVS